MNIIGVGIDIIENERVRKVLEKWPEAFRKKVFLPKEIEYCDQKKFFFRNYAVRFACKEAAFKACGVGWGRFMGWLDVEVTRAPSGKPSLVFHGKGKVLAEYKQVKDVMVALSHSNEYAVAEVILLG